MKSATELLQNLPLLQKEGDFPLEKIENISINSKEVTKNTLFVALKGTQVDGHAYIDQAIENGARVVLCSQLPPSLNPKVCYIKVANTLESLTLCCQFFFDQPQEKIRLVGITGTNGKSSTVTLLHELFEKQNIKAGLLSTIVNKISQKISPSTHTTPDLISTYRLLAQMVEAGCGYCFMEVSSHALDQERLKGLSFDLAIFSNLTRDHLDYHQNFQQYLLAKQKLFNGLSKNAIALTNIDDKNGIIMVQNTPAKVFTYSLYHPAHFQGQCRSNTLEGLELCFDQISFTSSLLGFFNVYNLLAVYAAARLLIPEISPQSWIQTLSSLHKPTGRFEHILLPNSVHVVIDYAHTPDALENVLSTLSQIKTPDTKIISIFGCGGNRDQGKRPLMAKIAEKYSDQLVFTSDNPRKEAIDTIFEDMFAGIEDRKKVEAIVDRQAAIFFGLSKATKNDIVLIAGKGHEKEQIIGSEKFPFSDFECVKKWQDTFC